MTKPYAEKSADLSLSWPTSHWLYLVTPYDEWEEVEVPVGKLIVFKFVPRDQWDWDSGAAVSEGSYCRVCEHRDGVKGDGWEKIRGFRELMLIDLPIGMGLNYELVDEGPREDSAEWLAYAEENDKGLIVDWEKFHEPSD